MNNTKTKERLSEVCECSIYYKKKTGLITVGRPYGTRFCYTPENFVKTFKIMKHPAYELNFFECGGKQN